MDEEEVERGGVGEKEQEEGDKIEILAQLQENGPVRKTEITPLPRAPMFVLCTILFCEAFNITSLFPFVAFMIEDFGMTSTEDEIGYYAGVLASLFNFAQFLSGPVWGVASDFYGRRPILLLGLAGNCICMTLFGLSRSYVWACTTRACAGLLNGNVGVAKSYLGEITDETNQAKGFSLIGLMWGVGVFSLLLYKSLAVSPLASRNDRRSSLWYFSFSRRTLCAKPSSFLHSYPYFLPCVLSAFAAFSALVLGSFLLPESNLRARGRVKCCRAKNKWRTPSGELDWAAKKKLEVEDSQVDVMELEQIERSESCSESGVAANGECDIGEIGLGEEEDEEDVEKTSPNTMKPQKEKCWFSSKRIEVVCGDSAERKNVIVSISVYGILAHIYVLFDELFPLWALKSVDNGGIDFNSSEIGIAQSVGGVGLVLFQTMFFTPIVGKFGKLRPFRWSALAAVPFHFLFPLLHFLGDTSAVLPITIVCLVFRSVMAVVSFTTSFLFINNSVRRERLGAINGLSQSTASFGRFLGPLVGGVGFAWSSSNGLPFPFNQSLMFFYMSVLALVMYFVSRLLPPSIDVPRDETERTRKRLDATERATSKKGVGC